MSRRSTTKKRDTPTQAQAPSARHRPIASQSSTTAIHPPPANRPTSIFTPLFERDDDYDFNIWDLLGVPDVPALARRANENVRLGVNTVFGAAIGVYRMVVDGLVDWVEAHRR
jgi:hypothetical protein